MTPEETIKELENYRAELAGIMERFIRSSDRYSIRREDDPRYRTIVIEIVDVINDLIGSNKYSKLVYQLFNDGISGYYQSPSFKSIEDIVSVVDSAVTWIKRNQDSLNKKEDPKPIEPTKTELKLPDKVTLKWLWEYVPHSFWALLGTLLIGAFGFGVKFADTDLYKSLTNPAAATKNSAVQSIRSSAVKK